MNKEKIIKNRQLITCICELLIIFILVVWNINKQCLHIGGGELSDDSTLADIIRIVLVIIIIFKSVVYFSVIMLADILNVLILKKNKRNNKVIRVLSILPSIAILLMTIKVWDINSIIELSPAIFLVLEIIIYTVLDHIVNNHKLPFES